MQAITTRCDLVKAQGAFIFHLCLCVFLTAAAFAQKQEAKTISYHQKVRTFHTAEEFARLTNGKVQLHKQPTLNVDDGATLVGAKGVILYREKNGQTAPSAIGALPVHE